MINDGPINWFWMALVVIIACVLLWGCESVTQTAIRENEPPAVAFVIAAQRGHNIQPAPAILFKSE